jgi:hypothetical protein
MGQSEKAWTAAIREFLSDGQPHLMSEAEDAGIALVPLERAQQEMGSKQPTQSEEDRIKTGKRNVAKQAITGMLRFGKAETGVDDNGKKTIRWISSQSTSVGPVAHRVSDLEKKVEELSLRLEAAESQVDFLVKKDAGEVSAAGEQYLASVGVSSESAE